MWSIFKQWFSTSRRREPQTANSRHLAEGARITAVSVDSTLCLAHEMCIHLCPQVFEFRDSSAHVKPDAASYFESRSAQILAAEENCPVEAIRVEVDEARRQGPAADYPRR